MNTKFLAWTTVCVRPIFVVVFLQKQKSTLLPLLQINNLSCCPCISVYIVPQWGAADAQIKVLSVENTELEGSPFRAWSRSVYSHTCYTYCQGFLPCLFLPFWSIHLHFFQNISRFLLCWLWLTHGSCVGLQNKTGHPAGSKFPCWVPTKYKQVQKTWLVVWWLVKWITWR